MDVLVCTSIKAYYLASNDIPKPIPQFFVGEDIKLEEVGQEWDYVDVKDPHSCLCWKVA